MTLQRKKIGILIEKYYEEQEIWYYKFRFAEEGAEVHFLSRLWGQGKLKFEGLQFQSSFESNKIECDKSYENMDDETLESYAAFIIPGGMVADRLRYSEDVNKLPPVTDFLKRIFARKDILKGINCHGMWLLAFTPELIKGRQVVVSNNLIGDVKNMGAIYVDEDVVVDGDLVTGRSADHCNVFARKIIDLLKQQSP